MPDLLAIEGLRAGYGEAVVLPGMTLSTSPKGQVLALLGRNGTGKTTLINSIVGITRRFGGTVALGGRTSRAMRPGPAGARRDRLGAAGAQHLPLADGGRKHDRGGAARAVDGRKGLRDVSAVDASGATISATSFPAASSRCWRSAVR